MPLSQQKTEDIQKQYDPMRKRAQVQEAANLQGANDAMARRAAAQGGGPGGAYEKQAQLAQEASARRLQDANEGIDAQQQGAVNQAREVQDQRDFQTSERTGSQQFASGERQASQTFAGQQQSQQIQAQKDMQAKQIEAAAAEGKLTRAQADKQLAEMQRQYDKDYAANEKTNIINTILSGVNSDIPPERIGHLMAVLGYPDFQGIPGLTDMKAGGAPAAAPAAQSSGSGQPSRSTSTGPNPYGY